MRTIRYRCRSTGMLTVGTLRNAAERSNRRNPGATVAAHSPRPPPPRRTDRGRQESYLLGVLGLEPPLPSSLPLSPRARWLSDPEISAPQLQKNSRIPSGSTRWAGRMAVEQTYSRGKDLRKHALRVRGNVLEELVDDQRLVLPARRLASGRLRGLGPRCSSAATKAWPGRTRPRPMPRAGRSPGSR